MRILVVGSGGREHALCWAIAASPLCDHLYCAPGNAGIADVAECVEVKAEDLDGLVSFAQNNAIDFVVVGPEAPLVAGLVDKLDAAGIKAFGPNAAAAQLEGSKAFTKGICDRHGIPTAAYARFTDLEAAKDYVTQQGAPIVIKADGLAAGKGVTVAQSVNEAISALEDAMSDKAFGAAGEEVVIEECLVGEEASFFALCDGKTALPLVAAQDHKAVGEGDTGPNTGGMGAYSPAPVMDEAMIGRVMEEIVQPTVDGMAAEGMPFKGVLFAGLMITADGPKLIEHNVRFGDPECEVLMVRLMSDLLPALIASADGQLDQITLRWRDETALCVVLASKGYPGSYEKNTLIAELPKDSDTVTTFHAGTARTDKGVLLATGGRVLVVTARGGSVSEAQKRAYESVGKVNWSNGFCRKDIGWRAVARESQV
ncbi:phosphoribosylamine--glycine ligase [Nisaea acidiphila]|uniref:Phosphoribosylamine--glycine ligase n=1 Tax=Nisaea acidiphila TaxID=1862145 RepID=A0A9J7AMQ2_9PROT|nr:phosphoribosylamine--glycine ligase [Nisaea acidiphila]UUX48234.1 phosphoribosylamine--glycine ligase [Nisaea acidiphila]